MIRFYSAGYTYLQLKFINESINPPCEDFSMEPTRKCKYCEYAHACRDMRRFIEHIVLISAERRDTTKRQ